MKLVLPNILVIIAVLGEYLILQSDKCTLHDKTICSMFRVLALAKGTSLL